MVDETKVTTLCLYLPQWTNLWDEWLIIISENYVAKQLRQTFMHRKMWFRMMISKSFETCRRQPIMSNKKQTINILEHFLEWHGRCEEHLNLQGMSDKQAHEYVEEYKEANMQRPSTVKQLDINGHYQCCTDIDTTRIQYGYRGTTILEIQGTTC